MRIHDLRQVTRAGRVRAEAEVEWESRDFPSRTLFFETSIEYADDFEASPNAFLLALAPLACWYGEERVEMQGPVCPVVFENARACALIMQRFYPYLCPPRLEVLAGFEAARPRLAARTASMMSGGVDALSVLRVNRLDYPLEHAHSIRECVCMFGLYGFDYQSDVDAGASEPVPERFAAWQDLFGRLAGLAEREHFSLIPLFTNVRTFCPDYVAWATALYSPMSVAGVHCLARRFDRLLFGSEGFGVEPEYCAASQLLCQSFSSAGLDVHMELDILSRLERVGILAEWDEGRALMQPCHWVEPPEAGQINCGRCEKCIRTMLCLAVINRLQDTEAFPDDDVQAEWIEGLKVPTSAKLGMLMALEEPLKCAGRKDLARSLRRLKRRTLRRQRKKPV